MSGGELSILIVNDKATLEENGRVVYAEREKRISSQLDKLVKIYYKTSRQYCRVFSQIDQKWSESEEKIVKSSERTSGIPILVSDPQTPKLPMHCECPDPKMSGTQTCTSYGSGYGACVPMALVGTGGSSSIGGSLSRKD